MTTTSSVIIKYLNIEDFQLEQEVKEQEIMTAIEVNVINGSNSTKSTYYNINSDQPDRSKTPVFNQKNKPQNERSTTPIQTKDKVCYFFNFQ